MGRPVEQVMADAAKDKENKYLTLGKASFPDLEMKPFVFDTLSGLSSSAISLIRSISKQGEISSLRNPHKFASNAIAAISVAIQVDNHAIVMRSFENARP